LVSEDTTMSWYIAHSAKGSEWKHHDYLKKTGTPGKMEDTGKYYYPDSYKGGRHLPKGESTSKKKSSDSAGEMEDWEKKVHEHLESIIKNNPDLFKTGADVARGILDENNFTAVKNTLKAFGVKVDDMSDDEIRKLRDKIASKYDDGSATEGVAKKESAKASKGSSKKDEKKEDNKNKKKVVKRSGTVRKNNMVDEAVNEKAERRKERAKSRKEKIEARKKKAVKHSAVYFLDEDFLEHNGILGMKWGKKNGPPYPLKAEDHSASEKKAGWRQSIGKVFGRKGEGEESKSGESSKSAGSTQKASTSEKKDVKDMTDEELNKALTRLRNEKAYKELTEGTSNNQQNQSSDKNSYNLKWSKNMTDKEAQDYINRLNNEKRYEELSQRDITQGKQFAKKLIIVGGTVAATTFVTTVGTKVGKAAAEKLISSMAAKATKK